MTRGTLLRTMSVSSSKKVNTSARTRNVRENQGLIQGEVAQDHVIQNERKTRAETMAVKGGLGRRFATFGEPSAVGAQRLQFLQQQFPARGQIGDLNGHAVDPPQQKQSAEEEENVAPPRAQPGRHPSLTGHLHADHGEEVIDHDQQNGEHKAGALAAFTGRQSQRNSDHGQNQAGGGQGEPALELDLVVAGLDEAVVVAAGVPTADAFRRLAFTSRVAQQAVQAEFGDREQVMGTGFVAG